ncbi:MAG: PadR family transcriptional regulator [Thermoleophilia bacterium]|nr:PadR family transcriptional regulator [Thermoleophilia bacterium]
MNELDDKFRSVRRGLLEFAVLTVIATRASYAADILARLAATDFATQEGTLYPLLGKLRRGELLEYEWVESETGPPRKYYHLTDDGKQHLSRLAAYWASLSTTIETLGAEPS